MIFKRGLNEDNAAPLFVVDSISESRSWSRPGMQGVEFSAPLYVHNTEQVGIVYERGGKSDKNPQFVSQSTIPNGLSFSNTASINYIAPLFVLGGDRGDHANFDLKKLQELFSDVEQPTEDAKKVYPEDIFDYIYASLNSPSYGTKYREFLKTDFPRVPRPKNWGLFWRLVELGRELRQLHLMKTELDYDTTFAQGGDNLVEQVKYENNNVYINATQYFGNVPELAWNFYVGGYQPAQKWLKDRKSRTLTGNDLEHYQQIIKILLETDRIMKQIG